MNGLFGLKNLAVTLAVCLAANFAIFRTANATPISNTNSCDGFASKWSPIDVQPLGLPFVFGDGTWGETANIFYFSNGRSTEGKLVYACRIVSESGQSIVTVVALKPESILFPQNGDSDEDACVGNFRPSRTSTKSSAHKAASQTHEWLLAGIVLVGYLCDQASILTKANPSKGFGGADSQPEVHASSPEPSVLSLLSIGFLGIARFVRRRRK